ncbi:MAG: hypothetical protein ACREBQ_14075, partial [Nitrososphaerales archaeon]
LSFRTTQFIEMEILNQLPLFRSSAVQLAWSGNLVLWPIPLSALSRMSQKGALTQELATRRLG